jgi:hypothetical protein
MVFSLACPINAAEEMIEIGLISERIDWGMLFNIDLSPDGRHKKRRCQKIF